MKSVIKVTAWMALASAVYAPIALTQESDAPASDAAGESAAPASGSEAGLDDIFSMMEESASQPAAQDDATAQDPVADDPTLAADTGGSSPAARPSGDLDTISLPEQDTVAKAGPRRRSGMIEEVVVTAQRREESAQDVPISITVFDGKQLANANITNSSDLAAYTPSLSTNQRFGADNATFAIRGFSQELRTTASVASYFAEVVAPRGQSSQTSGDGAGPGVMFDLANVQVLKGPQGTLFGRNTTGGAVLVVPNRPSDEYEGYIEITRGNEEYEFRNGKIEQGERETKRLQAVVNLPLTENFKLRWAYDQNERPGHLVNVSRIGADRLASADFYSTRLSSVWNITDSIENYTILTYIDSNSTGYSSQLFDCNPNYASGEFFLQFAGALHYDECRQQLQRQAAAGQNGFYDIVSTIQTPKTSIREKRLINTFNWEITDEIKLKNILAYAHLNTENGSDIFGTQFRYTLGLPVPPILGVTLPVTAIPGDPDAVAQNREFKTGVSVVNPTIPVTSQETYVAELQLLGTSFDGAVDWQTGFYFENSLPDGPSGNNSAGLISCNMASLEGDPAGYNCYDPLMGQVGGVLEQYFETTYKNSAVYSQVTWRMTEELGFTGGARYTWDKTTGEGTKIRHTWNLGVRQAPIMQRTTPSAISEAPTWLVQMDWKPLEGQMVYAKYIRGYRQGNVILAADPGADTFDPEKVDTYEIGLKTQFGGPIPGRFNLAAFTNNFVNQQLQLGYISPTSQQTTSIVNAGRSKIEGVEGEAFFQVGEDVTLALSVSFLNTILLEQQDQTARVAAAGAAAGGFVGGQIAAASVTPIAEVGDELPYAADQTYVAALNWRLPVPESWGEVSAGVTYSFIGKQRSAASSSGPYGMLNAFELFNFNFGWTRIAGSPLDFTMFGTNVLDEQYTVYTSGTYNLLAYESRSIGTPRYFGGRLKYNFGGSDEY